MSNVMMLVGNHLRLRNHLRFFLITAQDLLSAMSTAVTLIPSDIFNFPEIVSYATFDDDIFENEECLVFTIEFDENDLDPRDRGEVDIVRSVLLTRIQDTSFMCFQAQSFASILVDCDANFIFDRATCSFDGGPAELCK